MNVEKPKRGRPSKPFKEFNTPQKDAYLTVSELSNLLKMSSSHIYTLTSTKKIPHIKLLGKKILFDKKDIDTWLKSKTVSAK
jgi:excisionase family DNA binding protein